MSTIALVSALPQELDAVLSALADARSCVVAGRQFRVGRLGAHPVVAALSGIGKVAAATTATLLAQHFEATRLIFTGVAGGLHPSARVGDVVVGTECLQHDFDASPLFPRHELPGYGRARLQTDPLLSEALFGAAKALSEDPGAFLRPEVIEAFALQAPVAHQGLLLSGDRFVATAAESVALRTELPTALAVDMESAAVAQVCHDFSIAFGVVRTISDRADDSAHVDFPRFLQDAARHYSAQLVTRALARL